MILEIVVPGEPRPLQRPRRGPGGNFYTPRESIDQESSIAWAARSAGVRFGKREVVVHTDFFCGSKRVKDGDNLQKLIMDALQKAEVFSNDSQVVEGHWRIFRGAKRPRTEVRVYPISVDNLDV